MEINPFTTNYTVLAHDTITINAVYTNQSASADAWVEKAEDLLAASKLKIVGADVEFTPSGRNQKAAVLQLCVGQDCLVYHIACAADPISKKFDDFLRNWRYKFAGFDITRDRKMLGKYNLYINRHVDIQEIWKDPDLQKVGRDGELNGKQGLKDVAGNLIDNSYYEMKGGMTNDDHQVWHRAPLSQKHKDYAAKDAYVAYELYRQLDFYERGRYKVMSRSQRKRCRQW